MRARYYDPQVGRFISEDPLGFEGGDLNLYAYVGNNPIMGVDPSGLCKEDLGFRPGRGEAWAQTIGGGIAIVGGLLSLEAGGGYVTAGGIPIFTQGVTNLSIEYIFDGDTSDVPNDYKIWSDIFTGIKNEYFGD